MLDASPPHRRLSALNRRHSGRALVVIVPDTQAGASVRNVLYGQGTAAVGLQPASVLDLARRIGRIHPQAQGKTPLAPETVHELIRESLEAVDASTRASLQGRGGLDAVVRRVAEVVRLLRSNDVAPASLYALTAGSAVRPNRRAVVVGFEAVQRHLLAGSDYDDADVLGWATAQVRSGRAPYVTETVYAVYDGVELSEREAAFLRALCDEAEGFYRLGSASTPDDGPGVAPPPASVAARFSDVDVADVSDGFSGPEETGAGEDGPSRTVHVLRAKGRAEEQVDVALEYVDREGLPHDEVEILAPSAVCREVTASTGALRLRRYSRGGFGVRRHLVALWPQSASAPDASAPDASAPLLTDEDRETLAGLTGAVLPRSADDDRREVWHLTQALWRGAGAVGIDTMAAVHQNASNDTGGQSLEVAREEVGGRDVVRVVPAIDRCAYEKALGDLAAMLARLRGIPDDRERVHTASFVRSVLGQHGGDVTDAVVEALQRDLRAFESGTPGAWIEAADRLLGAAPVAWPEPEPRWTLVDLALRTTDTWHLIMVRHDRCEASARPEVSRRESSRPESSSSAASRSGSSRPASSAPEPADRQGVAEAVARAWSEATGEPAEAGFWRTEHEAWDAVASSDASAPPSSAPETVA